MNNDETPVKDYCYICQGVYVKNLKHDIANLISNSKPLQLKLLLCYARHLVASDFS